MGAWELMCICVYIYIYIYAYIQMDACVDAGMNECLDECIYGRMVDDG